jgi:HSP20 family protein
MVELKSRKEQRAMFELAIGPRNPWTVFDELELLQSDMNQLLSGREASRFERRPRLAYPPLNVWSSAEGLVIDAEIPGVDPKDVEISVKGDELTLRGKVNSLERSEGETIHRRERPAGEFVRTLQLPFRADAAAVKAACKNGILRMTLPRSEEEKPRKIAIATD